MRKFKKITSLILTLLFFITILPKFDIKVKADTLPTASLSVTLVGNIISANGLGTDWEPTNDKSLLKEYKNGIYEITVDFKAAISNGSYKVALNRNWDRAYGDTKSADGNKHIIVTAPGKVIFRFNSKTNDVFDSINNPEQFKTSASLVGTFVQSGGKDWNVADTTFALDYIGGGFYKKTFSLKAGTYAYKVAYNAAWSNGEFGSNVALTLATDASVTFISNPIDGICTDSIANPSILGSLSLIGTIRGGNGDWDATSKNYDFTNLSGAGKYIYSGFFAAGTYEYKGLEDYAWTSGGLPGGPGSSNVSITIPAGGKYVVFVADRVAKTLVDSINNPDKVSEALGLQAPPVVVKSPVLNANGSVTFNYQDNSAKQVFLEGDMTNWDGNKKEMALIDAKNGIFSITLRLGDAAYSGDYKFIVDGIGTIDSKNPDIDTTTGGGITTTGSAITTGSSILIIPANTGRKVVLAGTIQGIDGSATWDPASDKTKLNYDGNGNYSLTLKNVPAGSYQYKIGMGSWEPENYGASGVNHGANISLIVPVQEDVTFWYNDDSHNIVDSTYYKQVDVGLVGTGITTGTKLTDKSLSGIYSTKVILNKGTYSDVKAVLDGKDYLFGKVEVTTDTKDVIFSFDATTLMTFTDASSTPIAVNSLYFNSRDAQYKSPYGATPTDANITFNLKTGTDVTSAKIVLITPTGIQLVDMIQGVAFDVNSNKWTGNFSSSKIGQFKYYFVVSNGSDVKAYGDDDGFFGPGKAGQLGTVGYYDLNIYDKNYKTPDWMKNAVVYQIFPDRFFNGDTSNDNAQKLARGATAYENYNNWYAIPEDPTLEFMLNTDGTVQTNADGRKIPNPNYTGTKGDNVWANEMYGGDFKGIQAKLDYLQAVGINTLYMTPISQSISNHRYDTTDYKNPDPLLGHTEDFVNLATEAHKRNMHLIIDGVFNHVSDDSIYFDRYGKYMAKNKPIGAYQYWSRVYDLMNLNNVIQQDAQKQVTADLASQGITDLHYKDWFVITNTKVAAITGDPEHYSYEGWAAYDSMPVIQALNGSEYNVTTWANEIIDGPDANSRLWLKNGSNGWRLDVANEVSDQTWRNFRTAVKSEGDDVIIGEIWTDASKYLLGDMYDSVMNYRFRDAVLAYVENKDTNNMSATQAMNQLEAMREQYPKEAFEAMMNLVDSHDTQRIISDLDGAQKSVKAIAGKSSATALEKVRLIPLIQMTYPGAPTIYYGDEAAMPGADDPDNRRGMIWGKGDQSTVEWYAKLTNIRNAYKVLRTGDIVPIVVDDTNKADVMAYTRNDDTNHAVVAINRKATAINGVVLTANAPNGTILTNALNNSETYNVVDGNVTVNLPSYSGVILVANYTSVVVNTLALKDVYDPTYIVQEKTNDITALSSAIAAAQTLRETAKIGTAVGNVPQAAIDAFQSVINAANTATVATQTDVNGQVSALATATINFNNAVLVAPASGVGSGSGGLTPVVQIPVVVPIITKTDSNSNVVVTLDSSKIDKNNVNVIQIDESKAGSKVLVQIPASSIGIGTGSFQINTKAVSLSIPTSIIDSSLLSLGGTLQVSQNLMATTDATTLLQNIPAGAKTNGKIFSLGMAVYDSNNNLVSNIHNFAIGKSVGVTINLSTDDIKGMDSTKLSSFYFDVASKKWIDMGGSFDSVKMTYTFSTTHFTDFTIMQKSAVNVNRLSGLNRIETSIAIAKEQYTDKKSDAVILATANGFADALAGSGLAYKYNAPMLLVNKSVSDSQTVLDYITTNLSKDKNIYILGETGAVSKEIADYLTVQGYKVIRLGGKDRYETNQKIVDNLNVAKGTSLVIATGDDFADALSISSIADIKGFPVLLNSKDNLSASVSSYIINLQPTTVYVIGGTGVLSSNIEAQIKSLNGSITIVRLGGKDRYDTSMMIVDYFNLSTTTITVATGIDFPDALSGSVLAARKNSGVLLLDNKDITKQKDLLNKQKITNIIVFGGEGVISSDIVTSLLQK